MEEAGGRREANGGLPLEIRESRGNIAAAMNTIPLPVIAHAFPPSPLVLATTPRCRPAVNQPPLSRLPRCLSRVVVRDPRLTRARPLFSTRRSFVDAVLFVIPFVIPLPLFVARRHAPRCLTLSLSNRESRPIKPGGSFDARARARAIETTYAPITARVTNEYALLTIDVYPKSIHARNVADSF